MFRKYRNNSIQYSSRDTHSRTKHTTEAIGVLAAPSLDASQKVSVRFLHPAFGLRFRVSVSGFGGLQGVGVSGVSV